MHSGAVFPFDNISLTADDLYGIEAAVPDADARNGKCAHHRSFHGMEEASSDHKADKPCNHCRHWKNFPVILVEKHPQQFSEIDENLIDSSAVAYPDLS
jgi:hypothetical protein